MKKPFLLLLIILFFNAGCTIKWGNKVVYDYKPEKRNSKMPVNEFNAAMDDIADIIIKGMNNFKWKRIAIIGLKERFSYKNSNKNITEEIIRKVSKKIKGINASSIVEKHLINRALQNLKISNSKLLSYIEMSKSSNISEPLKKFGLLTGADVVLGGNIRDIAGKFRIIARFIDIEKREVYMTDIKQIKGFGIPAKFKKVP